MALKKEIKQFTAEAEKALQKGEGFEEYLPRFKAAIGFYQHERLIHLIVTMSFALFIFICLLMVFVAHKFFILPCVLMLALVVPYVMQYFFLENSVQKLYRIYLEMEEKCRKPLDKTK